MKFFSMLFGEKVHSAPGTKIIPADEFSTLQSALDLQKKMLSDAEEFKRETVVEAEKIKDLAFEEGFQEGLVSLNKHILELDKELKHLREDVQKNILPLAIKAARKIIGEELKHHPERIVDIVLNSLKPVTTHKKIVIYVNKADLALLDAEKPRIKQIFEQLDNLSIQERADIEPGGCIIETEAGIINAQLETQWRSFETAIESLKNK